MARKTEYLITRYSSDGRILMQVRAPRGVNIRLLLERLICRDLDIETAVNSCLRPTAKRFTDPFKIIDMREEHRRDQARNSLNQEDYLEDPIGTYTRARESSIPLGKTLFMAGEFRDYFVKEIEV